MYELIKMERYLGVNLLGPGPRLMKKNLSGRGLTKVEKHWLSTYLIENIIDAWLLNSVSACTS